MLKSIAMVMWWATATAGGDVDYLASPPVQAGGEEGPEGLEVNLRQLQDAHGLALLMEDDAAAAAIAEVIDEQNATFATRLRDDQELTRLEKELRDNFTAMFEGQNKTTAELLVEVEKFPTANRESVIAGWLRKHFWRAGVILPHDLEGLTKDRLQEICQGYQVRSQPDKMEPWRLRLLLWLLRDRQSLSLFARRDERVALLTTTKLLLPALGPRQAEALLRYLEILQELRLEADRRREDHSDGRTWRGLLRGLRYMETIREACQETGLDHRLMTRLLIQESAFVHERVSHAGAYSLAQFLDIAIKDVWLFRSRIVGAQKLLRGVKDAEDLRRRVVEDPRWAIRTACLYFRRLRDEVVYRLGEQGLQSSQEMLTLLSLELYVLRGDLEEKARMESQAEIDRVFSDGRVQVPLLAGPAALLPDAGCLLSEWMVATLRRFGERRLGEELFRQRLEELYQALGLAAYNAGMQNLLRAAKYSGRLGPLAFPLQIAETRTYIAEILAGRDLLGHLGEVASPLRRLGVEELNRLGERACRLAGP